MTFILKNRNLVLLFLSTFFFFSSFSALLPTLPLYLSENYSSNLKIGIIMGAFPIGVLAFRPFAGNFSDKKGRKSMLLLGSIVFSISPVLYSISQSFFYLVFIRIFHGIGISAYSTASAAFIADNAPTVQRGEVLGHMGLSNNLAFGFGPFIGVFLFKILTPVHFFLAFSLMAVLSVFLTIMIDEEPVSGMGQGQTPLKNLVFKRKILVASGTVLLLALIHGGILTFLPILVEPIETVGIGSFFLVFSAGAIIIRILAAKVSDTVGRGPVIFYTITIIIVTLLIISQINEMSDLLIAGALYGMAVGLIIPSLSAIVADSIDKKNMGSAYGFFYGAFDFGMISAGFVLGAVSDRIGLRQTFLLSTTVGIGAALLFLFFIQDTVKQSFWYVLRGQKPEFYCSLCPHIIGSGPCRLCRYGNKKD